MNLTICPAYDRPEEVKALFLEYTDFLLKSDPSFAAFLELQNYDRELDHLEEKYGMPKGRLYLALVDDAIAGCIALHPLSDTECELKRLYVKDAFRGQGIAEHLVEKLIDDAREMGYDAMLLDQCKFPLPLRLCLELLPFLPYAGLAFLAIPAFGFTGFYTVILLIGALAVDLLLARLLRLILGTVWIPSAVSGLLLGIFAAFAAL